jgi:hypothetical protein
MEIGQIRLANTPEEESTLAYHRVRSDGKPGCGDLVRPWEGMPMVFVNLGTGKPTCRRNGCRK